MKRRPWPIYAQFAEIMSKGEGRVFSGGKWIKVDPREIQRAVRDSIRIEEARWRESVE